MMVTALGDATVTPSEAVSPGGVAQSAPRPWRTEEIPVEAALREKLERLDRTRLARECARLDPAEERVLAEEGAAGDLADWPAY